MNIKKNEKNLPFVVLFFGFPPKSSKIIFIHGNIHPWKTRNLWERNVHLL